MNLSPDVRLVRAPNPSPVTLEGTNTYIVGGRNPVVIDPGPKIDSHLEQVLEAAGDVSLVVLTHSHPDHAEGAERFADMARAPLAAFAMPGLMEGAARIEDGQEFDGLRAIYTPGHASDHLSFWLEQERALFAGDHILGRGTTVIAWPDGDMAQYMRSLDIVRDLKPERVYPGHGPAIDEPMPVIEYYTQHRIEREQQVLDALDAGCSTVEDMVKRIYAEYDVSLHAAAALSVRAHLEKLKSEGRAHHTSHGWTL